MEVSPVIIVVALTLMWFVVYWLIAGVLFAIIGLVKFVRINTAKFSCVFTFLSLATAYAAAWTGYVAASRLDGKCLSKISAPYEAIPGAFRCATTIMISNGALWFIVLVAAGIALMFVSRLPERKHVQPKV
ncbi:MAG: hypothetical protein WAZ14_00720 [Patescibacteria group bacterium]